MFLKRKFLRRIPRWELKTTAHTGAMILRICHLQAGAWEGNNKNGKEDYHLRQWCSKYKTEKASITANYAGRQGTQLKHRCQSGR